ncbi:MAG: pseudouridine synthase [Sediminibacterium sp.]|nr:pseudouridine synthase [Sediminibacterium sp.]
MSMDNEEMMLNKYIAHCGICSRRAAVELIKNKQIQVNNKIIEEPFYVVKPTDHVSYKNHKITITKNKVYIILNKPKDYITTTQDTHDRKTVMNLIQQATTERIYPVGRLDRNTTGVLLFTNDGDLAKKLTHPSCNITKIYDIVLDKKLHPEHAQQLLKGFELEDGLSRFDQLMYLQEQDKTILRVQLHSGKNRIIRRMFEHLGYDVIKLDRIQFANLNKNKLARGKWRNLTSGELNILKYLQ